MAVERTIEHKDGTVERVTTTDGVGAPARSGSGGFGTLAAVIVALLAVAVIGYFLMDMSRNDAIQTNAVSSAAESVSGAAENVGEAAQKAGDAIPAPAAPAPAPQQ